MAHWAIDFVAIPLLLPFLCAWIILARLISFLAPFTIIPSIILAHKLYWAVPLAPAIWRGRRFRGGFQRLGFEATYCMNVVRRFLTLPLRPYTPDVYILGFPKCGTTALHTYLAQHPAVAALDGLPWHPALSKESHFFNGVLGRNSASSRTLYRSFFPTFLMRWWKERICGSGGWFCIDACPVFACLPYTARRIAAISPKAKLIFAVRNPVDASFSTEIMLRNLGLSLPWSFMEDVIASDPRFAETEDDIKFWNDLENLGVNDPLPTSLPNRFYMKCSTILRCAQYADRIKSFMEVFPKENITFVDFEELNKNPEKTVKGVLQFIGADITHPKYKFSPLPVSKGERRGRRMHPAVRRKLQHYFAIPNQKLFAIVGKEFSNWDSWVGGDEEEGSAEISPVEEIFLDAHAGSLPVPPGHAPALRKDSSLVKRTISITAQV